VRRAFGLDFGAATALAEREPAGCEGVNLLPYLTGERTPNWPHASGALTGLRPGQLRPGLLYRAALEAATFSLLAGAQRPHRVGLCCDAKWRQKCHSSRPGQCCSPARGGPAASANVASPFDVRPRQWLAVA